MKYADFVRQTVGAQSPDIQGSNAVDQRLALGALGLAGETGEVADIVKKMIFHQHSKTDDEFLDDLVGELGDVMWYIQLIVNTINEINTQRGVDPNNTTSIEGIVRSNIVKLVRRWPAQHPALVSSVVDRGDMIDVDFS